MKCKECGNSLRNGSREGLLLECERCAYLPPDCDCLSRYGYTPRRWVHCMTCDKLNIVAVDTTKKGWRGLEV